ncbi:amino acid transporter, putative [Trypanosoma brucei brucei TREU927]|uniref:Amino acid transporter, putative n=1 Tax=Trypanosoma brucei brucei (strain 927/4 GUTat10.1) TaxID=185431 RepID=Q381K0_TRYB2|nr:amino acid transporter, putative [Trypanosoma brucei brucei TREU927]EAN80531.1 amino acid transporter, putative [Trypanosoma brucei brucei TREU927]
MSPRATEPIINEDEHPTLIPSLSQGNVLELPPDSDKSTAAADGEHRGCLNTVFDPIKGVVPSGGMASNVFNLESATLGAGIVMLPSGFLNSGIIIATLMLVYICFTTVYSIRILVITRDKTGFRSYEEMACGLLGRGADYFTAFLMFVFCFGTCVGYVISVGDLLSPLLNQPSTTGFLRTSMGKNVIVGVVWLVAMLPLSLPKEINSLRYASAVGVFFIVFFVICMIVHAAMNGLKDGIGSDIRLVGDGWGILNGFTLFVFAFICQVNCFEVYEEMKGPTPRRMTRDSSVAMSMVGLLYFLSGIFGYLDFGNDLEGSVLKLYKPQDDVMMAIGYVGIAIKICGGFAICIQPSRDAIYYVLGWGKTSDVDSWKNLVVSGVLATLALVLGLVLPSIEVVFNFLGSFCGGFLAFILPALYYMYAGNFSLKEVGWFNYAVTYQLLIVGVFAVVFGTALTIYDEVKK